MHGGGKRSRRAGGVDGLAEQLPEARLHLTRKSRALYGGPDQVLPVDWEAITRQGDTKTNYQLQPGDRLYVEPKKR